jgi:hypothetical protein
VLEGEANSSRQEWGGSAVPFYREREGRGRDSRGRERDNRDFMALLMGPFPPRR